MGYTLPKLSWIKAGRTPERQHTVRSISPNTNTQLQCESVPTCLACKRERERKSLSGYYSKLLIFTENHQPAETHFPVLLLRVYGFSCPRTLSGGVNVNLCFTWYLLTIFVSLMQHQVGILRGVWLSNYK